MDKKNEETPKEEEFAIPLEFYMPKPEECIFFNNSRLSYMPQIPFEIKQVEVRKNSIKELIVPEENQILIFDASDNLINNLDQLNHLTTARTIDCSYNVVTEMPSLNLPNLIELYLISNDINKMNPMSLPSLKKLDLANNQIKKLEHLNYPELVELYISCNHIEKIENLKHLKNLKTLDLQYNSLKELDCLDLPDTIEILLLQGNKDLEKIVNIKELKNLIILGIKGTKFSREFREVNFSLW